MDNIIFSIEEFAQSWLEFILSSSLQIGIFLTLIATLAYIFRKQSAKFLYILWLIGLFKVIIPPTIKIPDFFGSANLPIEPNIFILSIPKISFVTTALTTPELSYKGYILLFWISGIFFISAVWIFNNIRFYRKLKQNSFSIDNPQLSNLVKYKNSRIRFYSGPDITIPFTRGIFKPKIFLPNQSLTWSKNELRAVVLHEYAHIKRKDIVMILFQNLIQILFFFHPLVWLANIQIARYREKACDDFAINAMKGNSVDYSKFLLKSIDNALNWQPLPSMSNYFNQSKKSLLNRFEYILNRKENAMNKFSRLQKFVFLFLVVIGVAISCHKHQISGGTGTSTENKFRGSKYSQNQFRAALVDSQIVDFDVPPTPQNGFGQYEEFLKYPKFLKDRGPFYNLKINEKGEVVQKEIISDIKFKNVSKSKLMAQLIAGVISGDKIGTINWKPAQKDNKPITAWLTIPIVFVNELAEKTITRFQKLNPNVKLSDYWTESIETAYNLNNEIPPPPPPTNSADVQFIPYDDPPQPIGGFKAIQENLQYPEIARKAGIEGTVIVYAKIDTEGVVTNTNIVKPLGENNGCNEAAVQALKSIKWIPAKQRDKSVAVWVSVPVKFKLSQETKEGFLVPESDIPPDALNKKSLPKDELEKLPYDTPPEPIGGYKELYKRIRYPEAASLLRTEGTVTIYTKVDDQGKVVDYRIKEPYGKGGFSKSAIEAINSIKWHPAYLQGKAVEAWFTVPIHFKSGVKEYIEQKKKDIEYFRKSYMKTTDYYKKSRDPIPHDEPPSPIEGLATVQRNLQYPVEARKKGIEGTVIVYTEVSADGSIGITQIEKSLSFYCDKAAIEAIRKTKWQPAKQKGKPVTVWISVPVKFKLNGGKRKAASEDHKENEEIKFDEVLLKYYPPSEQYKNDDIQFVPYDDPPQPVGGFKAIQKKLYYPEIARKAGIEGTVIIYARVSTDGKIIDTKVVKPLGNSGCNEAAIQAIKSVEWKPALQKDKPVTVWVTVPVKFKLK